MAILAGQRLVTVRSDTGEDTLPEPLTVNTAMDGNEWYWTAYNPDTPDRRPGDVTARGGPFPTEEKAILDVEATLNAKVERL